MTSYWCRTAFRLPVSAVQHENYQWLG